MEAATISSVVELVLKSGITLMGIFAAVIGLTIWFRTNSSHMVLSRLWQMFNGDKECKTPSINDFLGKQSDLLQFRFMTGIRARTLTQVDELIDWSRKNNENMAHIGACGEYFDIEKIKLIKPSKKLAGLCVLLTVIFGYGVVFSAVGVAYNRAVLTMKESGTWFSTDGKYAKPLNGAAGFSLSQCPELIKQKNDLGFDAGDVAKICSSAETLETKEYIATTVSIQRWLAGTAGIFFWLPVLRRIS